VGDLVDLADVVSTPNPATTPLRVATVLLIILAAVWGYVIAVLPGIGCVISDTEPAGFDAWYCNAQSARILVWGVAASALPAAVWARMRAVKTGSWLIVFAGVVAAAASPLVMLYVARAFYGG
jgi:hypothetical protein